MRASCGNAGYAAPGFSDFTSGSGGSFAACSAMARYFASAYCSRRYSEYGGSMPERITRGDEETRMSSRSFGR